MFENILHFIRSLFKSDGFIPLHEPFLGGNEKKYLTECIDSGFVSSVGKFVDEFENSVSHYTGAKYATATVNGTAALQVALLLSNIKPGDEVLIQPLTFIATANAISYCQAFPVFLDIDTDTLGLSAEKLDQFLKQNTTVRKDGHSYNNLTGRRIIACMPMHTFGHPVRIEEIENICNHHNIVVIEDAAESVGSKFKDKHTGTFGKMGVFSFNGNKTITTGGGGIILTNDETLAQQAKHLTTQAKVQHPWEYIHDQIGFNYRLPNINAALGCAQMENLELMILKKRTLADKYAKFFQSTELQFFTEPPYSRSNYWLNTLIMENKEQRDQFLKYTNENGIMTRPVWQLISNLDMYKDCQTINIENATELAEKIVNIPSSANF